MKSSIRKTNKQAAFTIVELLTVMSIIVILIGLLVPALNRVKIYAKGVRQKAQFHSIDAALELFSNEFDGYPESDAVDPTGQSYCGAMKLCEAMMGWDLLGYHTNSVFRRDGTAPIKAPDGTTTDMFLYNPTELAARRGPFLPLENANAFRLGDLYPPDSPGLDRFRVGGTGFPSDSPFNFVLCDVYTRQLHNVKAGLPVLYYKANTANPLHLIDASGAVHRPPTPYDDAGNIYNFWDNQELIDLGKPLVTGGAGTEEDQHELADYERFYKNTRSDKITTIAKPNRSDSYILISAGYDAEYGTADDICNFEWKYQP